MKSAKKMYKRHRFPPEIIHVDQDGKVVDVFIQKRRDGKAAKRF